MLHHFARDSICIACCLVSRNGGFIRQHSLVVLHKKSCLVYIRPMLDGEGILHVGGRLGNVAISYDAKHQLFLPYCNHVTNLIFQSIITKQVTLVQSMYCLVCISCIGLSKDDQLGIKFSVNLLCAEIVQSLLFFAVNDMFLVMDESVH